MKRFLLPILLFAVLCVSLAAVTGCASSETENGGDQSTVNTVSSSQDGGNVSLPVDTPAEPTASTSQAEKTEYRIGETWTVDGLWTFTVESIEETQDRNPYSENNPGAVYIVTYSYTNLGYEEEYWDGLFLCFDQIVDSTGFMGYDYPGDVTYYAQEIPIGATCRAQACIGVDNAGLPIKVSVVKYDANEVKHSATFTLE